MKPRTLAALLGSIKKWEAIVAGTGLDEGADNCPLCHLFNGEHTDPECLCIGCPVFEKTQRDVCLGTPYDQWSSGFNGSRRIWPRQATTPDLVQLAQAELDFLRSLLPGRK